VVGSKGSKPGRKGVDNQRFRDKVGASERERRAAAVAPQATNRREVEMLELLWIILIGAVVGALAKLLMPGSDPGGFLVTALLGMAGAVVATLLGRMLGLYGPDQAAGFIASIVGAILVLFAYRRFRSPAA
jgi:uncharacterized membrane protein YeaQ/YmgE (transglycosylase-associated protein family)